MFRRRKIVDASSVSGIVHVYDIPNDPRAKDDEDALYRHYRRLSWLNLSWLDPDLLLKLVDSRLGRLILGDVEVKGVPEGEGCLGKWEDRVQAPTHRLTDEERDDRDYREQPLMRKVVRRLRAEGK